MGKSRIGESDGAAAVAAATSDFDGASREVRATAVRYLLQRLADSAEGNSVEVRVPPFGAVQCIEGPGHTRGTPPNVVEMDARTWLDLATGTLTWVDGIAAARIHASGQRADLTGYVPLAR
ncbi:sterol carrier family protein [Herbiconiux sp. CPCC 205763]|uniref:Sterol carrier family protein n=1 Tax=Herbiconiux aconitum TaxID=2970913 RepID=A0ABT2GLJ3_9MICO|nr:sterol carrier family protein [Herbiconiux aconitum]MCS5717038.1 sterol carrier family protein [Herbiconiux aconitum]